MGGRSKLFSEVGGAPLNTYQHDNQTLDIRELETRMDTNDDAILDIQQDIEELQTTSGQGLYILGNYAAGMTIENDRQYVRYNGDLYHWTGDVPFTTTGSFFAEAWWTGGAGNVVELPLTGFAEGTTVIPVNYNFSTATVYFNGQRQVAGEDNDVIISPANKTITFNHITLSPNDIVTLVLQSSDAISANLAIIEQAAKDAYKMVGWVLYRADELESGESLSLTRWNDAVRFELGGEYYRWDGALPKTISYGETSPSDEDQGLGKWVSIGDGSLRSDLGSSIGSSLIKTPVGDSVEDFIYGRSGFILSVDAARNLTGLKDKQRVNILGYYDTTPLSGGGTFIVDKTDTTTADDGGMTLVTTDGVRLKRWKSNINTSVSALYFGCVGDGAFDNTARSQQLINWATANGYDVDYPVGVYYHSGQVTKPQSFNAPKIFGAGSSGVSGRRTVLWFDSAIGLKIKGGSGQDCLSGIFDCVLKGKSDNTTVPLQIADQCGFDAVRCKFENAITACELYNESSGGFTEFCMLVDCVISSSCKQSLRYKRGSGNDSFHGSGMLRSVINEMSTSDLSSIQMDSGTLVYNAPMNFTVFKTNSNPVIQNNSGHGKNNVEGSIKYESGSASRTPYLCYGSSLSFCGTVNCLTEGLKLGTAALVDRVQVNSDGSTNVQRKRFSYKEVITSGGSLSYGYPANDDAYLIKITVSYTNYEYSYLLLVYRNPTDNGGSVTTLATLRQFNTAGYGAPTFSFSTGLGLTITNSSYPAAGVNVLYTVTPLGTRQNFLMM